MSFYNQRVSQKEFGNYTQTQWESDCLSCNNTNHLASQPISEDCQMCALYSPETITYHYFDTAIMLFGIIVFFMMINFFRRFFM